MRRDRVKCPKCLCEVDSLDCETGLCEKCLDHAMKDSARKASEEYMQRLFAEIGMPVSSDEFDAVRVHFLAGDRNGYKRGREEMKRKVLALFRSDLLGALAFSQYDRFKTKIEQLGEGG